MERYGLASNKFRSLDDFSRSLDAEQIWRRKELSDLRQAIRDANAVSQPTLLRAFVPMCYAHWEGFVIEIASLYFGYITARRYNFSALSPHFLRLAMLRRLDAGTASKNFRDKLEFFDELQKVSEKRFSRVPKELIVSGSNLNSERIRNLCILCDVPSAFMDGQEDFLDIVVLKRRNEIAHGEWASIELIEINEISDGILKLMAGFRNEIENSIVLEKHLRKN